MEKGIVYWGIGRICKACLEQHVDIIPEFFIDSYSDRKLFCEKQVRHPDEVADWSAYYIVITVRDSKGIETELESRGLHKGKDFLGYREFFSYTDLPMKESLDLIKEYGTRHEKSSGPIMLQAPISNVRNAKSYYSFLKEYVKNRKPDEVVLFTHLSVISSDKISKDFGCTVFDVPWIYEKEWRQKKGYGSQFTITEYLSEEEINWLYELEDRKTSVNKEESLRCSQELYCYYKKAVSIIRPSKIIIWGNWHRESYILGHIAEVRGIRHGYLEHGWIPGTNQFDPYGIAGQGEYAVVPDVLEKISIKEEDLSAAQRVTDYIKARQLDTRVFYETRADRLEMEKLDPTKKTIFLVGMDELGMEMNPYSRYWRQYISSIYLSVKEVLDDLLEICTENKLNLIFKPHPGNTILNLNEDDYNRMIYVKDMSIDRLIQISDVVVSIASAVDYKVLMYEKPLVQVGITGLRGKKCSYEVARREDLGKEISMALRHGMTMEQKRNYDQFLARLLKKYLWDDMSEKEISYGLTLDTDFGEEGE